MSIFGAMFHPPGGILRHDAVVWGLAKGASARGVDIHQQTAVTGVGVENGKIVSVETDRGKIHTPRVLLSAGGYSAGICHEMLGIKFTPVFGLSTSKQRSTPRRQRRLPHKRHPP